MMIVAVDPGPELSAVVSLRENARGGLAIVYAAKLPNAELLEALGDPTQLPINLAEHAPAVLVLEQIESFGMAVGRSVFETVFWTGRFAQAWPGGYGRSFERVPRSSVKLALCHTRRANDSEIRQAITDRYGATKEQAIGTKHNPGPLFGLKADQWSALAVGLTWHELARESATAVALPSPPPAPEW